MQQVMGAINTNLQPIMKASNISSKSQSKKEPTRLMDYFEQRQSYLESQLENNGNRFMVKESDQDILIRKLQSVNEMMKYLINSQQNITNQMKNDQNFRLLDMVEGTLRKRIAKQNAITLSRFESPSDLSHTEFIQRIKLRLLQFSSKTDVSSSSPQISNNQSSKLRKYSSNLPITQRFPPTFCRSDNHLHKKI